MCRSLSAVPTPCMGCVTQVSAGVQAVFVPGGDQGLRQLLAAEPSIHPRGASTGTCSAPTQGPADGRAAQALEGFLAARCSFYPPNSPIIYCRSRG